MQHKPLRKVSKKQQEKNKLWNEITNQKCKELDYRCQWCGRYGVRVGDNAFMLLAGHHIRNRSQGGSYDKENCYVCHWLPCHLEIRDNNVDVNKYPDRLSWLQRFWD